MRLWLLIKNNNRKMLHIFMVTTEVYGEIKKVHHFEWKH